MQVHGGAAPSPYFNVNSSAMSVGSTRYDTNRHIFQVYDGMNWVDIPPAYPVISLNSEAEELLDWAKEQRNRQRELEKLAKEKPAIQSALDIVDKAKAQLEVTIILSKETV